MGTNFFLSHVLHNLSKYSKIKLLSLLQKPSYFLRLLDCGSIYLYHKTSLTPNHLHKLPIL